jgi:Methyltransferase domain
MKTNGPFRLKGAGLKIFLHGLQPGPPLSYLDTMALNGSRGSIGILERVRRDAPVAEPIRSGAPEPKGVNKMCMISGQQLNRYVEGGLRQVEGWFGRVDAEIYRSVITAQNEANLPGAMAEIGVHHGKSFIAMCLGLKDQERGYCVDIFEDQHLNKDLSGRGNRAKLEENLQRFGIALKDIVITKSSSLDIAAADILAEVGEVRFFSVDGGHWLEIVLNDLTIAEGCLAEHGVIAIDDFHRPEWPDVSAGYFAWCNVRAKPLLPFAIGSNKLYVCHRKWFDFYRDRVESTPFLHSMKTKHCQFQGVEIPVFQSLSLADATVNARLRRYVRTYHPEFYVRLKKYRSLISRRR